MERKMKIYVAEPEPSERQLLSQELAGHELIYLRSTEEAPPDAEILSTFINFRVDAGFLEKHPALRLIATRSTTVDHIDLASCIRRGICVSNVPNYGTHTIAEHTFALIL